MAQPSIPKVNVLTGDDVIALETAINSLIDQSIKNVEQTDSNLILITTQDGTNISVAIMAGQNGIISGLDFAFTGSLTANVLAGNLQGHGKSESFGSSTPLTFTARHATLPRIDVVASTVSNPPTMSVIAGTAAANPTPPTIPSGSVALHYVWIDSSFPTTPNDRVIGSRYINPELPKDNLIQFGDEAIQSEFPFKPKTIDYDAAKPVFKADRIGIDCSAGVVTVPLPDPNDIEGEEIVYFDDSGNASTNNITLDAGAEFINAANTLVISNNYGSATLLAKGGRYYAR